MHFEVLVEDASGKVFLDIILPKIIGDNDTFFVHSYKGIGRIPKDLSSASDPAKRILLDQLPRILAGYGRAFQHDSEQWQRAVIVVCDVDDREIGAFRAELQEILRVCNPAPRAEFFFSIEEGEAWLLGSESAVIQAYPKARRRVFASYVQDSICGTWERLADAIYPGGASALKNQGWQAVGAQKVEWARNISPLIDVFDHNSPSFNFFRNGVSKISRREDVA